MTHHGHFRHCCCRSRAYCEACSDEAAYALGQLVLAPLVALGVVIAALARRPVTALVLLIVGLVALALVGVLS